MFTPIREHFNIQISDIKPDLTQNAPSESPYHERMSNMMTGNFIEHEVGLESLEKRTIELTPGIQSFRSMSIL